MSSRSSAFLAAVFLGGSSGCNMITGADDLRFDPCLLTPSSALSETDLRGGTGGSPFNDPCPAGQVIVGFSWLDYQGYLSGLRAICGKLRLSEDYPYTIKLEPGATLAAHGVLGDGGSTVMCPAHEMVVGVEGSMYTDLDSGASFVVQLILRCAPLLVSGRPEAPSLSIGFTTTSAPLGASFGDSFEPVDCAEGEVVFMSRGRSGLWLDAFGIGCAAPSFDCQ
jgi:hypothetical protein